MPMAVTYPSSSAPSSSASHSQGRPALELRASIVVPSTTIVLEPVALLEDEDLAARYRAAHEDYLARRAELGDVPEIDGISAGGMPTRVKCLHVLVAHSLAAGPGVNPLGDEALDLLPEWWHTSPCVGTDEGSER